MRIIWDNNRFQAELTPGENWRNDLDCVKSAKFITDGAESGWIWYTTRVVPIDKLKKDRPLSGLVLTELAFKKYTELSRKQQEKEELKKQFKKEQKKANKKAKESEVELPTYVDEETGITCILVSPPAERFKSMYPKVDYSKLPKCMICEEPLFPPFDGNLVCGWCG